MLDKRYRVRRRISGVLLVCTLSGGLVACEAFKDAGAIRSQVNAELGVPADVMVSNAHGQVVVEVTLIGRVPLDEPVLGEKVRKIALRHVPEADEVRVSQKTTVRGSLAPSLRIGARERVESVLRASAQ